MTILILRYLIAAPFAILWLICLTGNTWLVITTIANRFAQPIATPLGVIGFIAGLIAIAIAPLGLYVNWCVLLGLAVLPELPAMVLAIIAMLRPPQRPTFQR